MSKLRSVDTKIWSDTWFEELDVEAKLLFIYLITNEKTNMLGIYESSVKKISFETGIEKNNVEKHLELFQAEGKVNHKSNHVILINFLKHQKFNVNMKKSAIDVYNGLPEDLKSGDFELTKSDLVKDWERLCNYLGMVSKPLPNHTETLSKVEVEDEIEFKEEFEKQEELLTVAENHAKHISKKYGKDLKDCLNQAKKAYQSYSSNGWKDSYGNNVPTEPLLFTKKLDKTYLSIGKLKDEINMNSEPKISGVL